MIARMSSSEAEVGGIALPGTPSRIHWKMRSSVAPEIHRRVRSGPTAPVASAEWQSAQRCAKSAAPRGAS
jgi:hypothetical protein